ncbi:translation initiation factor IF-2-like [Schistocerca gregaria]|uniref:translation initiation factor IF-2-like n=1 Tax=Schistocerca gregaria TaxID=7010 RepID=UPI00211E628F|nr:translation initiation factor IF-2-like [Schistocerca gregaria]
MMSSVLLSCFGSRWGAVTQAGRAEKKFYSQARKPRTAKTGSTVWIQKQNQKRSWKLERRKRTELMLSGQYSSKTLASAIGVRTVDVLKVLIRMNECPTTSDAFLNSELVDLIVTEFGRVPVRGKNVEDDIYPRELPEDLSAYPRRSPVVTIMGHVNHGKTTLLDALRGSNICSEEKAGITQRIAAFSVKVAAYDTTITFIDTPGHAAFSRMRQRGARVTDIAVLMVAADSGVQEQTEQTIRYIQETGCEVIVAINKCDKPNADTKRVRYQLAEKGVILEQFGGDVLDVEISALKKQGLDALLEAILLKAEELDLRADPTGFAEADILDVRKHHFHGIVANCILRLGSLKKGDAMIAGRGYGTVKRLLDENDNAITTVKPGEPFSVLGWDVGPNPGDELISCDSYKKVKSAAAYRHSCICDVTTERYYNELQSEQLQEKELEQRDQLHAVELGSDPLEYAQQQKILREQSRVKIVPFSIHADSAGSFEFIEDALNSFPQNEVKARITKTTVGKITERDIVEASLVENKVSIIGFNVSITEKARVLAQQEKIAVQCFQVVYPLINWAKEILSKHLKPREVINVLATAKVLQVFTVKIEKKLVKIAGCHVVSGTFKKKLCQILRHDRVVFEGPIRQLRHLKTEVKQISPGMECGVYMGLNVEFEVDDVINNIERVYVPRTLEESKAEHDKLQVSAKRSLPEKPAAR